MIFKIIQFLFHLIGLVLCVFFLYFVKDPGFHPSEFTMIGYGFHIVFLFITSVELIMDTIAVVVVKTDDFKSRKRKPSVGAVMLVVIVACLGPYFDVFAYSDFVDHKDQVIIESTNFEGLTEESDGYDYLNFSIDVSFKEHEVNHFYVHTLIFKGDKFIGHIRSDFGGDSEREARNEIIGRYFTSNSEKKLDFHLSHWRGSSFDSDALFKELYYGNPEDYTFVSNVIYVSFCDGTNVGQWITGFFDYHYDENGKIHYTEE